MKMMKMMMKIEMPFLMEPLTSKKAIHLKVVRAPLTVKTASLLN
jgi:hypothetical protein